MMATKKQPAQTALKINELAETQLVSTVSNIRSFRESVNKKEKLRHAERSRSMCSAIQRRIARIHASGIGGAKKGPETPPVHLEMPFDRPEIASDTVEIEFYKVETQSDRAEMRSDTMETRFDPAEVASDTVEIKFDTPEIGSDIVEIQVDAVEITIDAAEIDTDRVEFPLDSWELHPTGRKLLLT